MLKSKTNHHPNAKLNVERHSRRSFLSLCAGIAVSLAMPSAYAKQLKVKERSLAFHNLHTGESWARAYWIQGRYLKDSLNEVNYLLRDHRTGDIYPINRRLLDLLYLLKLTIGTHQPFHIISGYRSPKTNAFLRKTRSGVAEKSLHMEGKAIDIRLPSYDLSQLQHAALSLRAGGVGYYPVYNFIHVDVGSIRSW